MEKLYNELRKAIHEQNKNLTILPQCELAEYNK